VVLLTPKSFIALVTDDGEGCLSVPIHCTISTLLQACNSTIDALLHSHKQCKVLPFILKELPLEFSIEKLASSTIAQFLSGISTLPGL